RALDVLRERGLGRVAFLVALREHLLHEAEAVVTHEHAAARVAAHLDEAPPERFEIVARKRDVLTGVIAVPLDELRDLRLLAPVDAFHQRDAEVAEVDAPELHAAVG